MRFIFKLLRRAIGLLIKLAIIIGILYALGTTVLADTQLGALVQRIAESAATTAATSVLDMSGVKEVAEQTLREHSSNIADAAGVSDAAVEAIIDDLDIASWEVTTLPDGAVEASSFTTTYSGTTATLTVYTDPSYVTVSAYGQAITLSVPESARQYLSYLAAL